MHVLDIAILQVLTRSHAHHHLLKILEAVFLAMKLSVQPFTSIIMCVAILGRKTIKLIYSTTSFLI